MTLGGEDHRSTDISTKFGLLLVRRNLDQACLLLRILALLAHDNCFWCLSSDRLASERRDGEIRAQLRRQAFGGHPGMFG